MSDRTNAGRSFQDRLLLATAEGRFVVLAACLVAIIGITVGGHLYGRYLASRDLGGRDNAIAQLQAESQKLKRALDEKSAEATELQAKLASVQATLNAIMPTANTYNISPNQSLAVADGRLTIGLVGSPGNESVTLAINGKEQTATAGQVIAVAPDPSTNCQVQVQSFDMFKAVLTASCAATKAN